LPGYARLSYYEVWFHGLVALMRERGLVTDDELRAGELQAVPRPVPRVLQAADVDAVLARGAPTARLGVGAPRFGPGQRVRTYAGEVPHHTRLPRYARGRVGTIESSRGMHVFADAHAAGRGEMPQWLYTVVFDGPDLWPDAAPGSQVSIDAWEPYLSTA
jgi:nitrile hydratase